MWHNLFMLKHPVRMQGEIESAPEEKFLGLCLKQKKPYDYERKEK